MVKETPRQRIEKIEKLNGNDGFYGIHYQFAILIKNDLYKKATKIMKSLNTGLLWTNERLVHDTIYNYLLDGLSTKDIKLKF